MKDATHLPSVWFSANVHTEEDRMGGACQKKGTKEEYLTMTVILADCRQNQKDAAHLCDKADFCKRNIKAIH